MLASQLLSRVTTTLIDEGNVQWTIPELLTNLISGIKVTIGLRPDAAIKNARVRLQPGVNQVIPDDGSYLVDIPYNYHDLISAEIGTAITLVDQKSLDNFDPFWPRYSADVVVKHYMYDRKTPRVFRVFPAQPALPGYVEMQYVIKFETLELNDPIPLDPQFEDPLYFYVLATAYSKQAKRGDFAKEQMYYNLFKQALGLEVESKTAITPGVSDGQPE